MDQNKGSLQWIAGKCNQMRQKEGKDVLGFKIKVLNASKLLSSLLTAAGDCHSMVWCENVITSHAFDYANGTDCAFHEELDCIDCALGVPKRMAYLMSHILRDSYGITLSAKHLPAIKAFENIRIKEEDEKEEPDIEFTLNEEDVINDEKEEEETEEGKGWNPPEEDKSFDVRQEVEKKKIRKIENFKNKKYIEHSFEVPKPKSPPFSRRTQLSHIRKRRD